ncbi:MAG: acetate--CoA ligase family protein [Spirochaetales bacterium]|uniref:Acetate--CoA ligase family protein n=1 Tax=Candidatus Thalassospirochaeta sargassi TaxID=3119039 RepID=A0AAJ1IGQ9_9SPIO|nr:acetate--CoA ligase family protein [Spirochaetales bacterium]
MKAKVECWLNTLRVEGKPDEWESKELLKQIGLSVPRGLRILPEEELSANELEFPLVLKVCDPEIMHKTDRGGVYLNVSKPEFQASLIKLRKKFPGSPVLAESMCRVEGPEFILGALVDPVFGPAVMAGAGGIFTELYEDVSFRLCPCPEDEAVRMLKELKISPVLRGYRGSRLELESLAESVSLLSKLFEAFDGRLNQVDINPMVYCGSGWTALDCVLILNQ